MGALIATGAVWLVAEALHVPLRVTLHSGRPAQHFGLLFLLRFALGFSILGWLVLAALERVTQRSRSIWTGMGVGFLAISSVPIALARGSAATKVTLIAIHLSVAASLLTLMRPGQRTRS